MQYLQLEIEVTRPLPRIYVPHGYQGVGLRLRRFAKPVGFVMLPVAEGSTLDAAQLGRSILAKAARDLVRAGLRDSRPAAAGPSEARISVAVCTRDRAERLATCLQSILRLNRPELDVLVVDNAPSDQTTRALAQSLAGVRYLVEPKPGLDFARNTAVREARGTHIAFLDDDVAVDRAWLEALETAIRRYPDAGAFTGPVLPLELRSRAQVLFEERGGFSHGFGTVRYVQQSLRKATYPCNAGMFGAGCNMTFARDLLLRLGLFDEALDTGPLLPGGGDLDMFFRVLRADRPLVYDGSIVVYHQHRREYRQLRHQMWTWGLGFMAYVTKHRRGDPACRNRFRLMTVVSLAYFIRMAVLSAAGRLRHRWSPDLALAELAARAIQGLAGEYGRSQRRIRAIRTIHS